MLVYLVSSYVCIRDRRRDRAAPRRRRELVDVTVLGLVGGAPSSGDRERPRVTYVIASDL